MRKNQAAPPGASGVRESAGLGFSKVGNSKKGNGTVGQDGAESRAQLVDQYGRIVTPQPMVPTKGPADAARQPEAVSQGLNSSRQSDAGNDRYESMSAGGFSDAVDDDKASQTSGDDAGSVTEHEEGMDTERNVAGTKGKSGFVRRAAEVAKERLDDAQLETLVSIILRETESVTLFHAPTSRFQADGFEGPAVLASNARYESAVATIARSGADVYPSKGVQTLAPPSKNKDVQATPPSTRSSEAQASSWDISDCAAALSVEEDGWKGGKGGQKGINAVVDALVSVSLATPGCLLDADADVQLVSRPHVWNAVVGKGKGDAGAASANASHTTSRRSSLAGPGPAQGSGKGAGVGVVNSRSSDESGSGVGAVHASRSTSLSRRGSEAWGTGSAGSVRSGEGEGDPTAPESGAGRGKDGAVGTVQGMREGGVDGADAEAPSERVDVLVQQQAASVLSSHALSLALGLVERAVQQNLYHTSHVKYRSGPAQDLLESLLRAGASGGHAAAAGVLAAHTAASISSPGRKGGRHGKSGVRKGVGEGGECDPQPRVEGSDEEGQEQPTTPTKGSGSEVGAQDDKPTVGMPTHSPTPAPGLTRLFAYTCSAVKGLNVNCMTWNKANRDLLAVGYGPYDFAGAGGGDKGGSKRAGAGLIALWTLANPEHPQAILHTPDGVGVTSLDFSSTMPNVLAAGLYDGSICLWDVALVFTGRSDGSPILTSDKLSPGAHSEAVWGVQWVVKSPGVEGAAGRGKVSGTEVLASISTDGRVTEWSISKGLSAAPLMTLKRARAAPSEGGAGGAMTVTKGKETDKKAGSGPNPGDALGATGSEGLLSRTASGLAIDFHPTNPTLYFVGTEDGLLARCSTSYGEQYLDVIPGHAGPVNRARLSPFLPSGMLTASSDGTCKLWNAGPGGHAWSAGAAITYTVEGAEESVTDCAWSPSVSTRFASVTRDGHVSVWDAAVLTKPALDVCVTVEEEDYRATCDAQCAVASATARALWASDRAKLRASMGEDEPDDPTDVLEEEGRDDELQDALDAIAHAFGSKRVRPAAKHGKKAQAQAGKVEEEKDGREDEEEGKPKARKVMTNRGKYTIPPPARGAPPKKLSCVLFADNTHVLLTGDASGRVDVYRLTGLSGAADGSGAPAPGSEEHEEQLEALRNILNTL